MTSILDVTSDEELITRSDLFFKKIDSNMSYKSNYSGELMSFDWVDEIENACPFIDNVVRHPKLTLIREENIVKIEKSKKITVASVKDLSRHTNFISKVDPKTKDVQPSKILDVRNEETYNIYENRFLYTLIDTMSRFVMKKEDLLNNFEIKDDKLLEYVGKTVTDKDNVNIEIKVTSNSLPKEQSDKKLVKEIESVKERLKRIKEYITSWQRSEMIKSLEKAHVPFVIPPIKKTNIILKNPNFQIAVNLWGFLQTYDYVDKDDEKDNLDSDGDERLKGFLDHSFMVDYFILDSISKSKREQKDKLAKYAVLMVTKEIDRILKLLLNSGVEITDADLLDLIAKQLKNDSKTRFVGADDVKKKFKSAMEEYLERTQDYL